MTKALVTGGTGFIGAALVKHLLVSGYEVSVFDNNFRGNNHNLVDVKDHIQLFEGDIRDSESVEKACKNQNVLFHLAFINGTENFYTKPELVLDVGISGHINAMNGAKKNDLDCFVYASSSEVYQTADHIPTTEEVACIVPDVRNPRFSYGGAKLTGELLTLHGLSKSIQSRIFRPHNIYGAAMGFEHVIPQIAKKIYYASEKLSRSEATIEIQGNGMETRAFCHVSDAVKGVRAVYENGLNKNIYHIGKDEETSIRDLCYAIAENMGVTKLSIQTGPLQAGSTLRRCPDIEKIKSIGYQPTMSLKDGLSDTIGWYVNHFNQQEDKS